MNLHSIDLERHVLGGLIQNPGVFPELESFLSEKAFVAKTHDVIFSCLRSAILNNEKIDKTILAQKITNLGISFKEDIAIFDYIEAISFAPVTPESTIESAKELIKLEVLRRVSNTCDSIKSHLNKSINQKLDKTLSEIDSIYGEKINSFSFEDEPTNLFSDIYEICEETRLKPQEDIGLTWPYPEFNKFYGGARGGNIYAIASRPAQGKTTFLNYTAIQMGKINKCPVLILDTEMSTKEIKFRTAVALSTVPLYFLETGNWSKSSNYVEKVRKDLKAIQGSQEVYHYHVGNKTVDEVCSIIRRWYLSVVGRGNKCIVVYDYLKLTGEKLSNFWAEHQALGEKVDKFKRIAEEFDFPFLTAIQLNRSGENSGSNSITDDGSAISQTDRLQWFCTYLAIFRRRTEEEIILDTPDSGTHKLIEIKARYQGKEAAGHNDRIRREFPDGRVRYMRNFLNYYIDNFTVEERGSLIDCIARQKAQFKVEDKPLVREEDLLT